MLVSGVVKYFSQRHKFGAEINITTSDYTYRCKSRGLHDTRGAEAVHLAKKPDLVLSIDFGQWFLLYSCVTFIRIKAKRDNGWDDYYPNIVFF